MIEKQNSTANALAAPRHVSPLLATAIIAFPILFIWLLLRRGFAPSTRRAAFTYFVATAMPYFLVALAGTLGLA